MRVVAACQMSYDLAIGSLTISVLAVPVVMLFGFMKLVMRKESALSYPEIYRTCSPPAAFVAIAGKLFLPVLRMVCVALCLSVVAFMVHIVLC